jgi:hypothetical protein
MMKKFMTSGAPLAEMSLEEAREEGKRHPLPGR